MGNNSERYDIINKCVEDIFQKYDRNYSGYLERDEIELMLVSQSKFTNLPRTSCTYAEIERVLLPVDTNMDGKISKSELRNLMIKMN